MRKYVVTGILALLASGMSSESVSISSSGPGRPPNSTSTSSSKPNSQNGSLRLGGLRICARSTKQRRYSL